MNKGVAIVLSLALFITTLACCEENQFPKNYYSSSSFFINRKININLKSTNSYAVIFDAGSSGSRVHVFCFDENINLVAIGGELELFVQTKPGLSSYAANPKLATDSLLPLLEQAEKVVPEELHSVTPIRVGATAGLRSLEGNTSEAILNEVRDLIKLKSEFKLQSDSVSILDGSQEGSYLWVALNYLLGNLGKKLSKTVGVIDLGGGSIQMAYAISKEDAGEAPKLSDTYVKEMLLKGTKYYLYVHSYLNFGLLAGRVEIFKAAGGGVTVNPCILAGFHGCYSYGGRVYNTSSSPSGSNMNQCRKLAFKALKIKRTKCPYKQCSFDGIWNGGGGDGQDNLYVASFFFDKAAEAGFIDGSMSSAKVTPKHFRDAAKRVCKTSLVDAKKVYLHTDEQDLPYLCMDLVYQYTLLVNGFGLGHRQEITLVQNVKYHDSLVQAAWPLGSAIIKIMSPSA